MSDITRRDFLKLFVSAVGSFGLQKIGMQSNEISEKSEEPADDFASVSRRDDTEVCSVSFPGSEFEFYIHPDCGPVDMNTRVGLDGTGYLVPVDSNEEAIGIVLSSEYDESGIFKATVLITTHYGVAGCWELR